MQEIVKRLDELQDEWRDRRDPAILAEIQLLQRKAVSLVPKKVYMYFVTVNYKPDISLSSAMTAMNRLTSRNIITKYWYNFEQRGSDTDTCGEGLHSHLILYSCQTQSHFKRDVFNTLKNYVGSEKHVDIRMYPLEMFADKLAYLSGQKWSEEKDAKCKMDRLFRVQNNLELYYTNAGSSSSLGA